ncbi:MAG: hypothetical protein WBZ24_01845, partial [Anaerolineales bacterium]
LTSPSMAIAVLVVGLAFQLRGWALSGSIQGLPDTLARLGEPAWERGARWVLGDNFGDYVHFVTERTAEDSSIVLPPHSILVPYAEVGLMQFYFFPRKVYNCGPNEAEACMYRARTQHTYVLAVPHFPPPDEALKYKDYVAFNDSLGLYIPRLPGSGNEGN